MAEHIPSEVDLDQEEGEIGELEAENIGAPILRIVSDTNSSTDGHDALKCPPFAISTVRSWGNYNEEPRASRELLPLSVYRVVIALLWPTIEATGLALHLQRDLTPLFLQSYRIGLRRFLRLDFATSTEAALVVRRCEAYLLAIGGLETSPPAFVVCSVTEAPVLRSPLQSSSSVSAETLEGSFQASPWPPSEITLDTSNLASDSTDGLARGVRFPPGFNFSATDKIINETRENLANFTALEPWFSRRIPWTSRVDARKLRPVSWWCEHVSLDVQREDYRKLVARFGFTNRYVLMQNLPPEIATANELRKFIEKITQCTEDFEIEMMESATPDAKPPTVAHIAFKTKKGAQAAARKLQQQLESATEPHNHIEIEFTGPRRSNQTLWVGNIREFMTKEPFRQGFLSLFAGFGPVTRIKLMPERSCSFVEFESAEFAKCARNHLQGFTFGVIGKQIQLNVDFSAGEPGMASKPPIISSECSFCCPDRIEAQIKPHPLSSVIGGVELRGDEQHKPVYDNHLPVITDEATGNLSPPPRPPPTMLMDSSLSIQRSVSQSRDSMPRARQQDRSASSAESLSATSYYPTNIMTTNNKNNDDPPPGPPEASNQRDSTSRRGRSSSWSLSSSSYSRNRKRRGGFSPLTRGYHRSPGTVWWQRVSKRRRRNYNTYNHNQSNSSPCNERRRRGGSSSSCCREKKLSNHRDCRYESIDSPICHRQADEHRHNRRCRRPFPSDEKYYEYRSKAKSPQQQQQQQHSSEKSTLKNSMDQQKLDVKKKFSKFEEQRSNDFRNDHDRENNTEKIYSNDLILETTRKISWESSSHEEKENCLKMDLRCSPSNNSRGSNSTNKNDDIIIATSSHKLKRQTTSIETVKKKLDINKLKSETQQNPQPVIQTTTINLGSVSSKQLALTNLSSDESSQKKENSNRLLPDLQRANKKIINTQPAPQKRLIDNNIENLNKPDEQQQQQQQSCGEVNLEQRRRLVLQRKKNSTEKISTQTISGTKKLMKRRLGKIDPTSNHQKQQNRPPKITENIKRPSFSDITKTTETPLSKSIDIKKICQLSKQGQDLCKIRFQLERGNSNISLPNVLDVVSRTTADKLRLRLNRRPDSFTVWKLIPNETCDEGPYASMWEYFESRSRIGLLETANLAIFIVPLDSETSEQYNSIVTKDRAIFAFACSRGIPKKNLQSNT